MVRGGLTEVTDEQKHECSEGVGRADRSKEHSTHKGPEVSACLARVNSRRLSCRNGGGHISQGFSFPDGPDLVSNAGDAGDTGSIPGLERSPGEGDGNHSKYCRENPMEPGGLQSIGSKESDTAEHVTTLAFPWG